jgi:hypothetical protein
MRLAADSSVVSVQDSTIIFGNTSTIGFNRLLTFEGTENELVFSGDKSVSFAQQDLSGMTITVDGADLEAGTVIATGVKGTLGDDDKLLNNHGAALAIVDGNLVVNAKLAENSTGSVYGGGSAENNGSDITQSVAGGLKQGTVFAGSGAGTDGDITTTVSGGTIDRNLYGGGKVSAGSTTLEISGGTVGMDVYGGIFSADGELGTANLTISNGTFGGMVVGGSRVNAGTGTVATVENVNLTISGGDFAGNFSNSDAGAAVFGAGYVYGTGSDADAAQYKVTGTSTVAVGADVTGAVYGGGFVCQNGFAEIAKTVITVTAGTVERVFGGGWAQTSGVSKVNSAEITVSGGKVGFIYAGGGNGEFGSSDTGDVTIAISGSGSADYVFLGGKYNNSTVASATLTLSGDAKEMIRISGYNGCGIDKTTGETQFFIDTDVTLVYLDYVDRLVIGENNTLTVNELLLVDPDQHMVLELNLGENGVLDMPESGDWVIMSGDALAGAYEQIEFRIGDETFALGQQYGETGNGFKWEDNSLKFGKLA